MGESTCNSIFYAVPSFAPSMSYSFFFFCSSSLLILFMTDGTANFNMHSLMEIALERCDTARCAILTMGNLAYKHGFYGSGILYNMFMSSPRNLVHSMLTLCIDKVGM